MDANKPEEEDVKDLVKSIAVFEAKSAIAKLKLAKFVVVKTIDTLGKTAKKVGNYVEKRNKK